MNDRPNVHFLKTPLACYMYEVNTNQMLKIPEEFYSGLQEYVKTGMASDAVMNYANALKAEGYLSSNRPTEMEHQESKFLDFHLGTNVEQMTLQVTQQCNFRCTYCTYAPKDFEYQRQHSSKRMTLETALKAVDFFAAHSVKRERVALGFYGGEPLLELNLIQKIVAYAEELFDGKDLIFPITTNGSLFTKDVVDFISKHNFNVLISLDGTPEIHNRSRKFAATGEGTYEEIERNLRYVQENYPDLYARISFNVVIDPRYSCVGLHELFSHHPLFVNANVNSTLISDESSMEHVTASDQYIYENSIYLFKALMAKKDRYPQEKASKVAVGTVGARSERLKKNMKISKGLPAKMSHGGPCIPGQRRVFVTVDGDLFPCERVSETSEVNRIGNIYEGFDIDKARTILNIAQLTPEECKNCWAIRHCMQCVRACDNNGELSRELKLHNCARVRSEVEEIFKEYLMYKELGYEL